jgi:pilus assembly protein CpaC
LDASIKNDQIPGIKTNRIKTLVDGNLGKPLLLSGLLQEDLQETRSGLPGLSEIPILGKLFASEDYQNKRSELVAILLPHLSPPESPQERISNEIPKGFLPIPRSHLNFEELMSAKEDEAFPWNLL